MTCYFLYTESRKEECDQDTTNQTKGEGADLCATTANRGKDATASSPNLLCVI